MEQDGTFDTSFWVNAHRSGLLPYVLERYILHDAPDVAAELRETNPSGREFHRLVQEGQVTEVAPAALSVREFGSGERAAMSLVIEYPDWVLLLNDRSPFQEATRRGLKVMCTPLLVVRLAEDGILDEGQALSFLQRLEALRTVSPSLLDLARAEFDA